MSRVTVTIVLIAVVRVSELFGPILITAAWRDKNRLHLSLSLCPDEEYDEPLFVETSTETLLAGMKANLFALAVLINGAITGGIQ